MITTCTVYHAIRTIAIWLQQPISIQHPMFDIKQQRTVKRQHTGWRAKKKKSAPEKRYDAQWRNERFISWFTVSFFIRGFAFSCISYIDIKNTVANECQPFTRRRNILRFLRLKEKKICLTCGKSSNYIIGATKCLHFHFIYLYHCKVRCRVEPANERQPIWT